MPPASTPDGFREILGLATSTSESGAGWNTFFKDLVARGLSGVALVTSDAHTGLVEAIGANLPGASWQRCRTHYTANLMSVCPKHAWTCCKLCDPRRIRWPFARVAHHVRVVSPEPVPSPVIGVGDGAALYALVDPNRAHAHDASGLRGREPLVLDVGWQRLAALAFLSSTGSGLPLG